MANYNAGSADAVGNVSWFEMIGTLDTVNSNANRAIIINSDGSKTELWSAIIGGNLTYDGGGNITSGTIRWMTRTNSGGTGLENIGNAFDHINVDAGTFWSLGDNAARFRLVFSGNDIIDNSGIDTGAIFDWLGGGPGGDQFISPTIGIGLGYVTYRLADSGVVVNMSNVALNQGEAAGDTYTNIRYLQGSPFADSLTGAGDMGRIEGLDGNDTISSSDSTSDELLGGAGDDRIFAGAGDDTLWGGTMAADSGTSDTIDFAGASQNATFGITLTLGANGDGVVTFLGTGTDTFTGFENVNGTPLIDQITGNQVANQLWGFGGNDELFAADGNDTLEGGTGSDNLRGGLGNDTIYGDSTSGDDGSIDTISWIDATGVLNYVLPEGGADVFAAPGLGTDTFTGIEGIVGSNIDFLELIGGNSSNNILWGMAGTDILAGAGGSDTLLGGLGNDIMKGGTGNDFIYGGDFSSDLGSNDVIVLDDGTAGITFTLGASGADTVNLTSIGLGTDTYTGIESVGGTNFADSLIGNSGANQLNGNNGNDTLRGGLGNDTLYGDAGTDLVSYVDYFTFSGFGFTLTLAEGGSGSFSAATLGVDDYYGIDGLQGTNYADNFTGNSSENLLLGELGNDTLTGGGGDDTLIGGAGADQLNGGANTAGGDTASYTGSSIGIVVDLLTNANFGGDAAGDSLSGIENVIGSGQIDILLGGIDSNVLEGGGGADFIFGRFGADTIRGGADGDTLFGDDASGFPDGTPGILFGADSIYGEGGNDNIYGEGGADFIDGGADVDTANYSTSPFGISVFLFNGQGFGPTGSYAAGDTFANIENVVGTAFVDQIFGDAAANTLEGHGGNDTLAGSLGSDILVGGSGADSFVFSSVAEGGPSGDIITDFTDNTDVLDLRTLFTAHSLSTVDPVGAGVLIVRALGPGSPHTEIAIDLDGSAGGGPAYNIATLLNVTPGLLSVGTDILVA